MSLSNLKTPEKKPNAIIGRSILFTAQKPKRGVTESQPTQQGGPAGRPQRRVPKRNYFERNTDEGDEIEDEVIPDSFDPANDSLPQTEQKADALGGLIKSHVETDKEAATPPKKSLKSQLQSEAQTEPATPPKKQDATAKPIASKTVAVSDKSKESHNVGHPPQSTSDEDDIYGASPDVRSKAVTKTTQKVPAGRAKPKVKSTKGKAVATKKQAVKDVETIVIDDDASSDYGDLEPLTNDDHRTNEPVRKDLQASQSIQAPSRDRQQSLVDDRRARKPHLVSFDRNGPRNQGMSESQLAKASQLHEQASSHLVSASHGGAKQGSSCIADDQDAPEPHTPELSESDSPTEEVASEYPASDGSPGASPTQRDDNRQSVPKSSQPRHGSTEQRKYSVQDYTLSSPQQEDKLKARNMKGHGAISFAPHINVSKFSDKNDNLVFAQAQSHGRMYDYQDGNLVTRSQPLPLPSGLAPPVQPQKRRSGFDVTRVEDGEDLDGQRHKRAKLSSSESIIKESGDNTGHPGRSADHDLPKQSKNHNSDNPFVGGGIFGHAKPTQFSQRLLGEGPKEDENTAVQLSETRRLEPGQNGESNPIARRMFQSLGANKPMIQYGKSSAPQRIPHPVKGHALGMRASLDEEVIPLQDTTERHKGGAAQVSPMGIVKALHQINEVSWTAPAMDN